MNNLFPFLEALRTLPVWRPDPLAQRWRHLIAELKIAQPLTRQQLLQIRFLFVRKRYPELLRLLKTLSEIQPG
ncbi:MAG: hypothetical protein ACAI44_23270 [Candidatus Sericytochromatia bacterium]